MKCPSRILVIGAGGNLGRRLVSRARARGHRVTAFLRDASRFNPEGVNEDATLNVIEADALNGTDLRRAMENQDAVVSAAGNAADGDAFVRTFGRIVDAAEEVRPSRLWMLGGTAVLTIPRTDRIAVGLPGVPRMYRPHAANWHRLEASHLDWVLMCPGPMKAASLDPSMPDLRVSIDEIPLDFPPCTRWAPRAALSLMLKWRLPQLVVTYEAVADLIVSHLQPGDRYTRHRIGVALPAGQRDCKEGWMLGHRGPDG